MINAQHNGFAFYKEELKNLELFASTMRAFARSAEELMAKRAVAPLSRKEERQFCDAMSALDSCSTVSQRVKGIPRKPWVNRALARTLDSLIISSYSDSPTSTSSHPRLDSESPEPGR